jgi:hypothetical protein
MTNKKVRFVLDGAWRNELAMVMRSAGLRFDAQKLIE